MHTILIIADTTTEIWITQSQWLGKEMIDIYIKNIAVNVSVYIIHIYLYIRKVGRVSLCLHLGHLLYYFAKRGKAS